MSIETLTNSSKSVVDVGVAEAEDHVGPVEDPLVVLLGDAHHVADDLQRQGPGQLG